MKTTKMLLWLSMAFCFLPITTPAAGDQLEPKSAPVSSPSEPGAACSRFELIAYFEGGENRYLGWSIAKIGDVTGDGSDDFAAGEPGANRVDVFSGHNGTLLCTINKPAYSESGLLIEGFGTAIEDGGSFNIDGCPAILIGAPYTGGCIECPLNLGLVLVYRSLCGCCFDKRGNVTGDALDKVDLSDLSALIAKLLGNDVYIPCVAEANINGIGTIDISDLSLLISHLTILPRPALQSCP